MGSSTSVPEASHSASATGSDEQAVQEMLEACVPGGSSCDPQQVADSIRTWFAQRARTSGAGQAEAVTDHGQEEIAALKAELDRLRQVQRNLSRRVETAVREACAKIAERRGMAAHPGICREIGAEIRAGGADGKHSLSLNGPVAGECFEPGQIWLSPRGFLWGVVGYASRQGKRKLYRAGKYAVMTWTALHNPKKCGSGRSSWQASATVEDLAAVQEQKARVLEAGGPRASLLRHILNRRNDPKPAG